MTPAERIKLIEDAAEPLSEMSRERMQLVLRQHGVKTWDNYDDGFDGMTTLSYCYDRLEDADDQTLRALHAYLVDGGTLDRQRGADDLWGQQSLRVFISHRHENAIFAGGVRDRLSALYATSAFVAHTDIIPSKIWRDQIRAALATCHFMVAIMDEHFHESVWCDQEVGWAMGRGVPIMPVRMAKPAIRRDGFLEEYQDCFVDPRKINSHAQLAEQIFSAALNYTRTHLATADALAEAFVLSPSFDHTRSLWALITKVPRWHGEQLRRLETAAKTNAQVSDANVAGKPVPDLVRELVHKFEPPPSDLWARRDPWASPASDEPPF